MATWLGEPNLVLQSIAQLEARSSLREFTISLADRLLALALHLHGSWLGLLGQALASISAAAAARVDEMQLSPVEAQLNLVPALFLLCSVLFCLSGGGKSERAIPSEKERKKEGEPRNRNRNKLLRAVKARRATLCGAIKISTGCRAGQPVSQLKRMEVGPDERASRTDGQEREQLVSAAAAKERQLNGQLKVGLSPPLHCVVIGRRRWTAQRSPVAALVSASQPGFGPYLRQLSAAAAEYLSRSCHRQKAKAKQKQLVASQ